MDDSRFDSLTRTLSTAGSRRHTLGGLLAGAFGLLGTQTEQVAAKKKPCPPCKKRKQGKCKKKLPDGTACSGGTCQGGRCVATAPPLTCASGQKPCGGRCIPSDQCCTHSDCPDFRPHCKAG